MFEIRSDNDHARLSHTAIGGSTTLFPTVEEAFAWMEDQGISSGFSISGAHEESAAK